MSLKDAIREAVDERDKQEGTREKASVAHIQHNEAISDEQTPPLRKSNAAKQQSSKAVELVQDQEQATSEEKLELAALTIRVSRQSRIHWLVSAKQQNTTLTAAIIEALNARFGEAGR